MKKKSVLLLNVLLLIFTGCSNDDEVINGVRNGEGYRGGIVYDGYTRQEIVKAFTTNDRAEKEWCVQQILKTDGDTGFMHESFNKDNAKDFTRSWFAWANTLFGELIVDMYAE